MSQTIEEIIQNVAQSNDLITFIKYIDDKYKDHFDFSITEYFSLFDKTYLKELMEKRKWNNEDDQFIYQEFSNGTGALFDELFLCKKCSDYYRILRLKYFKTLEMKQIDSKLARNFSILNMEKTDLIILFLIIVIAILVVLK
jgi:hypothetical protein